MKAASEKFPRHAVGDSGSNSTTVEHASRRGMTLLELLLVVAIMVVVASLAFPAVQRTFSTQALQKGADRVRVAMGQARVRAIKNGEEYAVFLSPGGTWFNVAPFVNYQEQDALAVQREKMSQQQLQSNYEDDLLPKGVEFVLDEVGADARSAEALAALGSGGSLRPILFYPDGTSQDARVVLRNEKEQYIEVQLRGLTGVAKTVRIDSAASR